MTVNDIFKALSDPTRRQILKLLQNGDMSAGEIAECFDISKPSISHHLNILKQGNLVQDVRKGQNIYYSINTTVFQELIAWFYQILGNNEKEILTENKERNLHGHNPKMTNHKGDDINHD